MADKQSGAPVRHHVLLERRGGASRVAHILAGLQRASRPVELSCELAEPDPAEEQGAQVLAPGDVAASIPAGAVAHVHATADWQALLQGFLKTGRRPVITAHDCMLFTGGCVYPLGCARVAEGCPDPCPRDFPESAKVRAAKVRLVEELKPLIVSPSSWLARKLRETWPGLAVRVVPNGVPIPETLEDKRTARQAFGIAEKARVALFLAHGGLKAAYKGGGRLQPLLSRLSRMVPGVLGVVAGGDETRVGDGLMLFPYLEGRLLRLLMRAADVLVYPTLADNHPLVVLEAMAHGLPVASFAVGGVPEQVSEGRTGVLAVPGDEAGLAAAVAGLLADPAQARAMGEAAREHAAKHFSARRMAADYEKVYQLTESGDS